MTTNRESIKKNESDELCDLLTRIGISVPPPHSPERSKFLNGTLMSALLTIYETTGELPSVNIVNNIREGLKGKNANLLNAALAVYRTTNGDPKGDGGVAERRKSIRRILNEEGGENRTAAPTIPHLTWKTLTPKASGITDAEWMSRRNRSSSQEIQAQA